MERPPDAREPSPLQPAPPARAAAPGWFLGLATVAILVPLLRFGRDVLVPVAIAAFVFILIVALGERTRRLSIGGVRAPAWVARILSFAIIVALIAGTARVIEGEAAQLVAAAPSYLDRLGERIVALAPLVGEATAARLRAGASGEEVGGALTRLIAPAGSLLGAATLILFYLLFMMAERDAFARKLPRVVGSEARAASVARTLAAISRSVQRYMWINTVTSIVAAACAYAVLAATGTEFAGPLAVLVFFTAFIPTVGTAFGIAFPALIALIQFGPEWQVWVVLGVGGVLRLLVDNVLQPAMAGRGLNLSPLVVMLGLALWAGLWGLAGAFLSVPLMVTLMIVCAHTPGLHAVAALLSADGEVATHD